MKKLTFLLGTLGGAMAGYIFSNKKLRTELKNAPDAAAAAKVLGKHLSADGQMVAKEAKQLAQEHHLDDRIAEGKKYVEGYYKSAKSEVQKFLGAKVKEATGVAKRAKRKIVRKIRG